MTSCIPPPSSKNRSATIVVCVGTARSTARPATMYCTNCSAAASSTQHSAFSHSTAVATSSDVSRFAPTSAPLTRELICSRSSATAADNSAVRAGASPNQNGTLGGAPCASSTSTLPADETRRTRQEVLPNRKMSPVMLSTAKSSCNVPTTIPSGSATTVYSA